MTQIIRLKTKILPLIIGGIGIYIIWWFFLTTPNIDERFSFFIFCLKYIKYFLFFIILWASLVDYRKLFIYSEPVHHTDTDSVIYMFIFFLSLVFGILLYSFIYHILGNNDNIGFEHPLSIFLGLILGSFPIFIFLLSIYEYIRKHIKGIEKSFRILKKTLRKS